MENDFILVLDLGGPQAVTMARKLRNQQYYTEIISRNADIDLFRRKSPRGILIVGGDVGVRADAFPRAVLSLGIPVLAMGGAARMMAEAEGASPEGLLLSETAAQITFAPCDLFEGLTVSDRYLPRIDGFALPEGYKPIASTAGGLIPAFADFDRNLYGLQFYAESNDPDGAAILSNFAERICGCTPKWTIENYIEEEVRFVQERVGHSSALMAVSGGVDSAVCAALMRRAIGDRLRCVFVDTGLLRENEAERVRNTYEGALGMPLICVDARVRFIQRLRGISDPVEKHRAVHNEFINVFSEVSQAHPDAEFLVKGTIYSDLLANGAADEAYARRFDSGTLLEPVRMLFKEEVRLAAEALELPAALAARQPFPAPGLAVRCGGEVTPEKLALLRQVDAVFRETMAENNQEKRLSQFFAVLPDGRALTVRGSRAEFGRICALRAVMEHGDSFTVGKLPYDLLDRASERILTEVPQISRVLYDISGGVCGAVEWE